MNRVVITGIGVVAPAGIGKREFWRNTLAGKSFVEADSEMAALGVASRVLSRVHGFDARAVFYRDEDHYLHQEDRFIQFGVAAGDMAIRDAGLLVKQESSDGIGVITSTAIGGTPTVSAAWEHFTAKGKRPFKYESLGPALHHATSSNFPGSVLMRRHGMRGICAALSTGCTAGIDAIGLSFALIRSGEAKVMLAGASEAPLAPISYATLDAIGALSIFDGDASKSSRPFDAKRAGFVLGEGAGVIVLESYEHAMSRGARIYSELLSFATGSNAYHMSDLPANGEPMSVALRRALVDAAVLPDEIHYINAHGSSTPQNDVFETSSFKAVLGKHAHRIPISSTKSMIGHSLSAASVMGVIAALGAIELSMVPPTINYEFADPDCDLDYVTGGARPVDVGTALVTASGFGGIHSVLVLKKVDKPHA
jgi:3-oxoacyl-(acyl-carrier-protein) synthase